MLLNMVFRTGIRYENGIVHVVGPENGITLPSYLLFEIHTLHAWCFGAIVWYRTRGRNGYYTM
jgi:homoaconitase/3-isopropylmalate dehydratase large subunit